MSPILIMPMPSLFSSVASRGRGISTCVKGTVTHCTHWFWVKVALITFISTFTTAVDNFNGNLFTLCKAVPSTRVAWAYSSSKKLELYFWARVLDNLFLQTPKTDKNWQTSCPNVCHTSTGQISLAWDDANQFWDCPSHTVGYPGIGYRLYDAHGT